MRNKETNAIELLEGIRNLLVLYLSQTKIPDQNIAKAAGIRKAKLYEFIPKQRQTKNKKNKSENGK